MRYPCGDAREDANLLCDFHWPNLDLYATSQFLDLMALFSVWALRHTFGHCDFILIARTKTMLDSES